MKKTILIIIFALLMAAGAFMAYRTKDSSQAPTGQHGSVGIHGQPVDQSHRGYKLEVISGTSNVDPKQPTRIVYTIRNDKGETIKNFDVVHEKIMHFITVRHDLQYFQHLHPEFNQQTGEFIVNATFPTDGPYRLFPDFTPTDENPQKLPVTVSHDVEVGNINNYKAQEIIPDTQTGKSVQGYDIEFSRPAGLKAQEEITYSLNISKNGTPITNLESYLGALGHSVILKEATLDFIHTHALEAKSRGPEIQFAATFPASGVYKIFTQFQHQGKVVTTDYALNVK